MKALVKERVSPYISQLYECGINDSDIKLVVDQFRSDVSGSSSLFLLRDDDKSDGIKLFSSGLTEAQQQFYVQHHRQDVWFNHYLDKGCQGIVSANSLSNSAGLLASFGAQFAAGGVCRVKGRGLSSLSTYRAATQDDFSAQEISSLGEVYSGLAAWSQHYWNLLALETQNYQLQQLVKTIINPAPSSMTKGISIIPTWPSIVLPTRTWNCERAMVFSRCKIRSSSASSKRY